MSFFKDILGFLKKLLGLEEASKPEKILNGLVRGISTMNMQHPNARAQAETIIQTLIDSKLKDVCLNLLCDGSFGSNTPFVKEQIKKLQASGCRVHMLYYVTNGPSQRDWANTQVPGAFTRVPPEDFRQAIRKDYSTRGKFKELCRRIRPLIEQADINYVCPMLEDNLDNNGFVAALGLCKEMLGATVKAYVRNPCPGCYPGNTAFAHGTKEEYHIHSQDRLDQIPKNGVLSNDGMALLFKGESNYYNRKAEYLPEWQDAKHIAGARNTWFYLWFPKYQGLGAQAPANPNDRSFVVPAESERRQIINFLTS